MTSCPAAEVLAKMWASETGVGELDEHVATCAPCREVVANLARGDAEVSMGQWPSIIGAPLLPLALHASAERRIGTTLSGKWRLERFLGSGGMASVYAAVHVSTSRRAAIKILRMTDDVELIARFVREAFVANQVPHPGAVQVHDTAIAEDGAPYLVMELLEGETLRQRAARGALTPAETLAVLRDLLTVLGSAHRNGVVHRDVKPENVFITNDGVVKVLDFGIAKVRDAAHESGTQSGALLGTPAFMPPEQARGQNRSVGPWSDVWSVAATGVFLLTGRPIYDGKGPAELLYLASRGEVGDVTRLSGEPKLGRVLKRALSKRPEDRFADADAMLLALEDTTQPTRRWKRNALAGLVVTVAVTIPVATMLRPRTGEQVERSRDVASAAQVVSTEAPSLARSPERERVPLLQPPLLMVSSSPIVVAPPGRARRPLASSLSSGGAPTATATANIPATASTEVVAPGSSRTLLERRF